MSGSAGVMARFLALAFLVVIGMSVYTFMVKTDLEAAQMKIGTVEKDRDTWKTRLTQYQTEGKTTTASLETCKGQVTELTAQLEAANSKKPPARR